MITDHNNLHLKPVKFKQDYQDIRKHMCGLLTASMQVDTHEFVCAVNFHKCFSRNPSWISFFFTHEKDYKDFCENIIGLLPEGHAFWYALTNEANEIKRVMDEHKNKT
jgi:hypothetical protein